MITIGTKVAIMPGAGYTDRFVGRTGIAKRACKGLIGVQIDGCTNPDSSYGVFWFEEKRLAIVPTTDVLTDNAINQVIFSGPKTIIKWSDGTKTIVSCGEGDQYDRYVGFCAAVTKKMFGSSSKIKKIIEQCTKEDKKNA